MSFYPLVASTFRVLLLQYSEATLGNQDFIFLPFKILFSMQRLDDLLERQNFQVAVKVIHAQKNAADTTRVLHLVIPAKLLQDQINAALIIQTSQAAITVK